MPVDRRTLWLFVRPPLLLIGVFILFSLITERVLAAEPTWIADSAQGCRVWNAAPKPNESVAWIGPCRDGVAEGNGVLIWYGADKTREVERDEGRFHLGRLWGHGWRRWANGLHLSGYWIDGRLSGHGAMSKPNGERYNGSWRNGRWTGFGTRVWANGDRYIGAWRDGKRQGYGIMNWASSGSRYEGGWDDDAMSGPGTRRWRDGSSYRGAWRDAARNGHGKLTMPDGATLDGEWIEDKPSGPCHIRWSGGTRYDGACLGLGPEGKGTRVLANGEIYEGDWVNGQRSGQGRMTRPDKTRYEGEWRLDKADGKGVISQADGTRYEGELIGGVRNGWGVETSPKNGRREGYWAGEHFLGQAWFARERPLDPPGWAQAHSDIAADPAVRFGTLPNGMRYAILKNDTPKDEVSFRLRIEAGSIDERPNQRGLAHFIEHMAFRGSTKIADGEAFRVLERLGGELGADTNAFTEQTQTSYHIDLPHGDRAAVDTALSLMRETASELSITPEAVESERSVVLAEERVTDTPELRETRDQLAFFYRGQPIGDHLPIGDKAVINAATPEALRIFYRAYYRPERATLIAVGAVDPAGLEKQIAAHFADWQGVGPAGIEPDRDPPLPRGNEIFVHSEANSPGRLLVNWLEPFDHAADTRRREADAVVDMLVVGAVNHLFETMAHAPGAPFSGVTFSHSLLSNAVRVTSLSIALPDVWRWQPGGEAAFGQLQRLLDSGLSQEDLDRQIELFRAAYQQAEAGAATRDSRALAEALQSSVDFAQVFRTPAADRALFEDVAAGLTPQKASAALRAMITADGPLFYVAAKRVPPDIETALPAAWAAAVPSAGSAAGAATAWPYVTFGEPGRLVSRSADTAHGIIRARFENGIGLAIRPSDVTKDQVVIHAHLDLPAWNRSAAIRPPYWSCAALMMGGVAKLSYDDLVDFMRRKSASITCGVGPHGVDLTLSASASQLDPALQVLAAYLSDPAWRPEALPQIHDQFSAAGTRLEGTLQGQFQRDSQIELHNGDLRWSVQPSPAEIERFTIDQARDYLGPALKEAQLQLVIAGDVTADRAVETVAATLGSLPRRTGQTIPAPKAGVVVFPPHDDKPKVLSGPRGANQTLVLMGWPTRDATGDLSSLYDLEIAATLMQRRLFDRFRTDLGSTYTPESSADGDFELPGYGYLYVQAVTPADKGPLFYKTVQAILADIRDHGIEADEFTRVVTPMIDSELRAEQGNAFWAAQLADPRYEAYAEGRAAALRHATPESVRSAIRTYMLDDKSWKLEIRPN